MPSRLHQLFARAVPAVRRSTELTSEEAELALLRAWHGEPGFVGRGLPAAAVPGLRRRWQVVERDLGFPCYELTPRDNPEPTRTLFYVHGGGFIAGIDPFHVRYATRLARAMGGARVILPDYPLTPEHTWRDSHEQLVTALGEHCRRSRVVLAGDSAGGGLGLAITMSARDRGLALPDRLVLHAPWVDLTTSTPDTVEFARRDPWLHLGKLRAYARWWAGSEADLGRPEVSPALGDLTGLPPGLMFYGTRDLLAPGCRLLTDRAMAAGWDLTSVEEPGLIHVFGIMPALPEARAAFRRTVGYLA